MKAIGKFFKVLFKIIYTLRLIPAVFTLVYALVLKFMKISFSEASGYIVALYVMAAFSVLYFVYGVVKPFAGGSKKQKPPKQKQSENYARPAPAQNAGYYDNGDNAYYAGGNPVGGYAPQAQAPVQRAQAKKYPVYYKAAQNENYIFAEYDDRYELFLKTDGGLKYVKTDFKDKL